MQPARPDLPVPAPPPKKRRWPLYVLGAVLLLGLGAAIGSPDNAVPTPLDPVDAPTESDVYSDERACELVDESLGQGTVTNANAEEKAELLREAFLVAEPDGAVEAAILDMIDFVTSGGAGDVDAITADLISACEEYLF